eukprot:m.539091 g.539091  ORF g.539091 m.539091 type:complete len:127 (+) comp57631_c0_seq15:199-579(+)
MRQTSELPDGLLQAKTLLRLLNGHLVKLAVEHQCQHPEKIGAITNHKCPCSPTLKTILRKTDRVKYETQRSRTTNKSKEGSNKPELAHAERQDSSKARCERQNHCACSVFGRAELPRLASYSRAGT